MKKAKEYFYAEFIANKNSENTFQIAIIQQAKDQPW
jgi:hypothetical protein